MKRLKLDPFCPQARKQLDVFAQNMTAYSQAPTEISSNFAPIDDEMNDCDGSEQKHNRIANQTHSRINDVNLSETAGMVDGQSAEQEYSRINNQLR